MKTKSKVLVSALLAIVLCVSLIAGTTFALFTSESSVNITVSSGKVDVKAAIGNLATSSLGVAQENGAWANGGKATVTGNTVSLENIMPGDSVSFDINVDNSDTTVSAKYRVTYVVVDGYVLAGGLDVVVGDLIDVTTKYKRFSTPWMDDIVATIPVTITLPNHTDSTIDNMYMGLNTNITFAVEAVQANGASTDAENETLTVVSNPASLKAACANGGYIVFSNDITTGRQGFKENGQNVYYDHSFYKIVKDTVIDLNGYTFTGGFKTIKNDNEPASVTIANGTIDATNNKLSRGFQGSGYNFTTTFENVTIEGGTYAAYVGWGDTLIIESGTYSALGSTDERYGNKFLLNIEDGSYKAGTSHIIVKGGTFKNFDPSDSQSENPNGNFVAEGYKVVSETIGDDVWYTVVPAE